MNLTMSITGEEEQVVKNNRHIKWTEIARKAIREEAIKLKKLQLLSKYLDKKPISAEEWRLMDRIDWHPVDEIALRDDFARGVLGASREKARKISGVDGLFG